MQGALTDHLMGFIFYNITNYIQQAGAELCQAHPQAVLTGFPSTATSKLIWTVYLGIRVWVFQYGWWLIKNFLVSWIVAEYWLRFLQHSAPSWNDWDMIKIIHERLTCYLANCIVWTEWTKFAFYPNLNLTEIFPKFVIQLAYLGAGSQLDRINLVLLLRILPHSNGWEKWLEHELGFSLA